MDAGDRHGAIFGIGRGKGVVKRPARQLAGINKTGWCGQIASVEPSVLRAAGVVGWRANVDKGIDAIYVNLEARAAAATAAGREQVVRGQVLDVGKGRAGRHRKVYAAIRGGGIRRKLHRPVGSMSGRHIRRPIKQRIVVGTGSAGRCQRAYGHGQS